MMMQALVSRKVKKRGAHTAERKTMKLLLKVLCLWSRVVL